MKILHATNGPLAGSSFALGPSTVIGRDGEVDIQLIDDGVSRRHACVVENEDGGFSVIDLGSSNGTKVDGQPIVATQLSARSKIEIGGTTFLFGDVDPQQVDTDVPNMKLTSGPALETTVMGEADDVLLRLRAEQAAKPAPTPCCESPLAAKAIEERWPHCPACGGTVG